MKKSRRGAGFAENSLRPLRLCGFFFSGILLLLFCSCAEKTTDLADAKKMALSIPKDTVSVPVIGENTVTFLLDGNKNGVVYYYEGAFDSTATIAALSLDSTKQNSFHSYTRAKDPSATSFVVKWTSEEKYGDVINLLDELKRCNASSKYALTGISQPEKKALSAKTGIQYTE